MGYIKIDGKLVYGYDSCSNEVFEQTWIDPETDKKRSEITCQPVVFREYKPKKSFEKSIERIAKEIIKSKTVLK